jgi:hypothetical protein
VSKRMRWDTDVPPNFNTSQPELLSDAGRSDAGTAVTGISVSNEADAARDAGVGAF